MASRPNVLMILTDMQRADTIAALGNPTIRTPSLDRLCHEGTAFTSAYTPCPVCVPARACLHYGQYPQSVGIYNNGVMPADDGSSYADRLTAAGYRTHAIGKCHFTPDPQAMRGFQTRARQEEMVGAPDKDDYLTDLQQQGFDYITDPHGVRGEMYYVPQVSQMPARLHPTQWVGDRAIDFIEKESGRDQPWYLTASFIHPHPPLNPPAPWHKLYRLGDVSLPMVPPDFESHWTYINRVQNRYKYRDHGIDYNLLRMIKAYYYACVSFVDYQVGRILDQLEKQGVLDDTLIVFTSDHGEYLGDYHCFGKRGMHDASSRIPMIARWPGAFEAGRVDDRPVSLVDLAPTFCAAAGAPTDGYDGQPLMEQSDRPYVFGQFAQGNAAQYMIVGRDYKYFYSAADEKEFLYDRRRQPAEHERLPLGPFNHGVADELRQELMRFLKGKGEDRGLVEQDNGKLAWRRFEERPAAPSADDPDAGLIIQDHKWADTRLPGYNA